MLTYLPDFSFCLLSNEKNRTREPKPIGVRPSLHQILFQLNQANSNRLMGDEQQSAAAAAAAEAATAAAAASGNV